MAAKYREVSEARSLGKIFQRLADEDAEIDWEKQELSVDMEGRS